jgi:hypothetical protein
MRAFHAAIAPLFASLLLIAAVIAPAHCLARAPHAPPGEVQYCLAPGLADPAPAEDGGSHLSAGICVVCLSAAAALPAAGSFAVRVLPVSEPVAYALPAARAPPPADGFTPGNPRAPPIA